MNAIFFQKKGKYIVLVKSNTCNNMFENRLF